jgi:signal transduction histidine kinase
MNDRPRTATPLKATALRGDYRGALGKVAHDIRSATGVAWTALTEIERATAPEDGGKSTVDPYLKIGRRSLRRLLLLADRLTLAGALEEGGLELTCCETNLRELLTAVVDDVSFALGRRTVDVSFDRGTSELLVVGDGRWLAAAFAELIGNAIRFGRSKVRVSAREDASHVTVTIEDDGPGLPDAARASLTTGQPTVESAHGLGVSLPLAHCVIGAHGGTIQVETTEPGKGTMISVALPNALVIASGSAKA